MSRSSLLQYIFGEDHMHHVKLNIYKQIYANSGSSSSVLTLIGVTIDGMEQVASRRCLISLVQSSIGMVEDLSGSVIETYFKFVRKIFVSWFPLSWPLSVLNNILTPKSVIPSYPSYYTRGLVIGGEFSECLLLLMISFIKACSSSGLWKMSLVH